jgi:hypothetical protein
MRIYDLPGSSLTDIVAGNRVNFVPVDNASVSSQTQWRASVISPPRGRLLDQVSGTITRVHSRSFICIFESSFIVSCTACVDRDFVSCKTGSCLCEDWFRLTAWEIRMLMCEADVRLEWNSKLGVYGYHNPQSVRQTWVRGYVRMKWKCNCEV